MCIRDSLLTARLAPLLLLSSVGNGLFSWKRRFDAGCHSPVVHARCWSIGCVQPDGRRRADTSTSLHPHGSLCRLPSLQPHARLLHWLEKWRGRPDRNPVLSAPLEDASQDASPTRNFPPGPVPFPGSRSEGPGEELM